MENTSEAVENQGDAPQPRLNGRAGVGGIAGQVVGGIAAERLGSFIERIEAFEAERRGLAGDLKEVYAEQKQPHERPAHWFADQLRADRSAARARSRDTAAERVRSERAHHFRRPSVG